MFPPVGVIGLGNMGKPMARNLLRAGHEVWLHNRSRAAVEELAAEGGRVAQSAAELAGRVEVILLSLPNWPDVEQVLFGAAGAATTARRGTVVLDTTSGLPAASARFAAELGRGGVEYLDAPVSGGDVGAREGTLSIMVGGPAVAFARVRPVLERLGRTIVHLGDVGAGNSAKLANQILVAVTLSGMAEALVFAARSGVSLPGLVEALRGGLARCGALEIKAPRVLQGDFRPGGKAEYQLKDLNHAFDRARELGLKLPVTELVRSLYQQLVQSGRGAEDHSAIIRLVEEAAGITARQ